MQLRGHASRGAQASVSVALALTLVAPLQLPSALAANACRVVDVDFTPTDDLQIVAWIEDTAGKYVDTIFITQATGSYGLGNRPGIKEFNSGPLWPYGRREMVFPVWAHRHGKEFPLVLFQNSTAINDTADRNLSHPFNQSSRETTYCRPFSPTEPSWDTASCASAAYTDKGTFAATNLKSKYPPREDVTRSAPDAASVAMFDELNPFDAVSQATPAGGAPYKISWSIPETLPAGNYVLFIETSKEFDHNAVYSKEKYPAPANLPWAEYGLPFRGQPAVVYRVPFTIADATVEASAAQYAGYSDPDGVDGNVREPDNTISVDVPGSGGARFALMPGSNGMYRVRVSARPEFDSVAPSAASGPGVARVDHKSATVVFAAPGDDGMVGKVTGYELRLRAGEPITEANFDSSMPVSSALVPEAPGSIQTVELTALLPETDYYLAVRAYDDCRNLGPLTVIPFSTSERVLGEVDACFVATAAYGSMMANEVEMLRHFRDAKLRQSVLGELLVEAYYTFGPAVSGVVGESELLRQTARGALAPVIDLVAPLRY